MTETPDEIPIPEPPEGDSQDHETEGPGLKLLQRALLVVRDAEAAARAAEDDLYNTPGYCLQQTRDWANIGPKFGTATIAWQNAERRQLNRKGRRGGFAFWTGGSKGYGHIGMYLSSEDDPWVRSTDAGGSGRVATRRLSWFDQNWPSLNYVGWTDNVNGVTVPGVLGDWVDMADKEDLRAVVREELRDAGFISKVGDEVWRREFNATNASGTSVKKPAREFLTTTWEAVKKLK
jgi:hypothetical protein